MNTQLTLALRYLWGRKLRSFFTTLAIVLGVMLVFGLNGVGPAVEASFRQSVAASSLQVPLIVSREGRVAFSAEVTRTVAGVPGISNASGAISRDLFLPSSRYLTASGGETVRTLTVYGIEPGSGDWLFDIVAAEQRALVAGRRLLPGDSNAVVISSALSEGSGLGAGSTLELPSAEGVTRFTVVGVLSGRSLVVGEERVFMPLAAAQALFGMPNQINAIGARFVQGADEAAVRQAVLAAIGPGYQLGEVAAGADAWATVMQMADLFFLMFGVLSLAMAGFIMFISFRTVVAERRRDIGLLRAVGASRRTVTRLVLAEGLAQAAIGTATGLLLGYLGAYGATALLGPVWQQFLHVPLGSPVFGVRTFVLALALGLGIPLLSVWLPARAASRISPLEALRPATAAVTWRAAGKRLALGGGVALLALLMLLPGNLGLSALGIVLFLVGLTVAGPALVQPVAQVFSRFFALVFAREAWLARGNLVRQPERAAVTASTVAIGLAIVIAFAGLATTSVTGLTGYLEKSMRADYLLLPESLVLGGGNVGAGPQLAQAVKALPGVAEVTSLRRADTEANGTGLQLVGVDPDTYPRLSGLVFLAGEPQQAFAALGQGRNIILNGIFAARQRLTLGQEVALQTAGGPKAYRVVGVGSDYLNAKFATAYISHANLAADFGVTADVLIMANLAPGADKAKVEAALLEVTRDYPAFGVMSYERLRESQTAGTDALAIGLYIVLSLLALPSLIALANTVGINVLERTREFGVLRAVGATRGQVQRMVLAESLLLVAMGAAFGILAGIWLGYVLVSAMVFVGLPLAYYFPYGGILSALAVALIFGVLAAMLPARRAAKLDVVAALAYE